MVDTTDRNETKTQTTQEPSELENEQSPAQPYSIYTRKEKWFLVTLVAIAGLFSPLPANIYFPAIPLLTQVFHKSVEEINLTVTIYLVMQGVGPMLWSHLADRLGRRPLFVVCLSILTLSCVGLALCPTSAFWLLMLLRAFQAGGCASTIALGAGVIGDIATNEERGGYFGMFNLGPMLAPCIGPALGGALADHLGWRSIFWFLTISAAVCLLLMLCCLPETLRALVGNGSIAPNKVWSKPLIPIVGRGVISTFSSSSSSPTPTTTQTPKQPKSNPFRLLLYPDVALTLTYTGIIHAVNYTITTTISSSFADIYPFLSDTALGLCYLAVGAGMIIGSTVTGRFLDYDYARIQRRHYGGDCEREAAKSQDDPNFPVEYARLRTMPILLVIFVGGVLAWGWLLKKRVHLAGPLVLQVVLGYTSISMLNTTMTLMIDIIRSQSSGVIACTNLVRCSLAAILVSLIDKSTRGLGYAWTYTVLGLISLLMLPLIVVEMKCGPKWRRQRSL